MNFWYSIMISLPLQLNIRIAGCECSVFIEGDFDFNSVIFYSFINELILKRKWLTMKHVTNMRYWRILAFNKHMFQSEKINSNVRHKNLVTYLLTLKLNKYSACIHGIQHI